MAINNFEHVTVVKSADGASQVVTAAGNPVLYSYIRWTASAGLVVGDSVEIRNAAGDVLWRAVAEVTTAASHESQVRIKSNSITVVFTDTSSGDLFLYHDIEST